MDIKEQIQTAQCFHALDVIRHALTVKSGWSCLKTRMFMDKELAYIQGMLSIGFMKGLRNRLPSIAQLKKQNMHNVA